MSDPLEELRIKPSMSGLVATISGQPTSMGDIASGLVGLGGLVAVILLGAMVWSTAQLGVSGDSAAVWLSGLLAVLLVINEVWGRGVFRPVRDRLAERYLPTKRAVTVLELTPRRLLINRTSELPRSVTLTGIRTVRREGGLLLLEGADETIRLDARLNSAAAVDWLHGELSRIIHDAGQPVQPPEALRRMLERTEKV